MFADKLAACFEAVHGLFELARSDCGCSDDEGAIGNCLGDSSVFLGILQKLRRADGGLRFAEGDLITIDDAEAQETEVTHCARSRSDVERVARGDEHDCDAVELVFTQQRRVAIRLLGHRLCTVRAATSGSWDIAQAFRAGLHGRRLGWNRLEFVEQLADGHDYEEVDGSGDEHKLNDGIEEVSVFDLRARIRNFRIGAD